MNTLVWNICGGCLEARVLGKIYYIISGVNTDGERNYQFYLELDHEDGDYLIASHDDLKVLIGKAEAHISNKSEPHHYIGN